MPAPTTTDELFDAIARSGLLPAEAVRAYQPPSGRLVNPEAVLARMVRDGLLTPFHARHITAGRSRGFFLTDKYKLLAHLGTGGTGHVYLCEHLLLHRLVAVKVLQTGAVAAEPGAVERFFREGRAVAALDDPNIVRVFDMDRAGDAPFLVMEYVDGTNLHAVVSQGGPLPTARAANYARQAALGLGHAHAAGLVHRDVKPGNLLLDRSGTVKVLDLGLARYFTDTARNKNLTARYDVGTVVGTADYIAPEQTQDSSAVDGRADIYGLGGTLYYLLAGRSPFEEGTVAQKLLWHQTKPPPPLAKFRADIPDGLAAVVAKMLAKDPNDRYATPAEVVDALAPWGAAVLPAPPVEEMPRVPASAYRLGVSPLPTGSQARAAPDPDLLFSSTGPSRDGEATARTENPATPRNYDRSVASKSDLLTTLAGETNPTHQLGAEDPCEPTRRRWRWYLAGLAVALVGVGIGLWFAFAGGQEPDPDPAPAQPRKPQPVAADAVPLALGGSTFAQKAVRRWAEEYPGRQNVNFAEYAGAGSGDGVAGLLAGKYHIAFTEVFLTDAQLAAARAAQKELRHIPVALGAVVPAYNLPEWKGPPLKFSGSVLADIFLGKIANWNSESLKACNDGRSLPDVPIKVVRRSDRSGTTAVWTEYLAASSAAWRAEMKAPAPGDANWRVGTGVAGNAAVAEAVTQTVGAIGYVELNAALEKNQSVGEVQNHDGNYIRATAESVAAAAARARMTSDLRFSLVHLPGPKTYPVVGTTWAVFDAKMSDARRRNTVTEFLRWVTHEGQAVAETLNFARLPPEMVGIVDVKLRD